MTAHCVESDITCPAVLTVKFVKLPNCVNDRIRYLYSLTQKGGLHTNPIVIDDTSADEESVGRPEFADEDDLIDLGNEVDDEIQMIESTSAIIPTAIATERMYPVAEEDDLFSEDDDEIDELAQDVNAALGDTDTTALGDTDTTVGEEKASKTVPKDEDFVTVPEDDYLSSSNTILYPLFQKLDDENKSSSSAEPTSSSSSLTTITLESTEHVSSKREFVNGVDQDAAIGNSLPSLTLIL